MRADRFRRPRDGPLERGLRRRVGARLEEKRSRIAEHGRVVRRTLHEREVGRPRVVDLVPVVERARRRPFAIEAIHRNPRFAARIDADMHVPDDIARTAAVKWQGDVAKGHGTIKTGSGLVSADYSFGTRFTSEPGTNPEELLAASHAACFTMALSASLTRAGHPPTSIDTTAKVHLKKSEGGFEIPHIELSTSAHVPGISDNDFQHLANQSKESCPISKALHAVPISLLATLHTA